MTPAATTVYDHLAISFSGGETSALMTYLCLSAWKNRAKTMTVVFANTGEENEQTLKFVALCDRHFGFNTVWIEAVVNPASKAPTGHKIVNFKTAARQGEPFEAVVSKYGIANTSHPHCTRELKIQPFQSFLNSLGIPKCPRAIGIRSDEAHRRGKTTRFNAVYPLLDWVPFTKTMVNQFWAAQPFRLDLAGYQENCKTCWKKSFRKLLTIMDESPQHFDFFERMEQQHGYTGAEFRSGKLPPGGRKRVWFRGHRSVADIRAMYAKGDFVKAENDALLDVDSGCVESCEIEG